MGDPRSMQQEAARVRPFVVPYARGRGLHVACGPYKMWPYMIGLDDASSWEQAVADITQDAKHLDLFAEESLDFIVCGALLDKLDTEERQSVLARWWGLLQTGRYLCLYGRATDLADDAIRQVAKGVTLVEETRCGGPEGPRLLVYRKDKEPGYLDLAGETAKPIKSLLIIRYGAIGDMMMLASALPALKAEGWHITVNTTPQGQKVLRDDPNIDAWLIQDKNQVPNEALADYFAALETRYAKVVNLSESIEGDLLVLEGRRNAQWDLETRRRIIGPVNYLERTHDLLGAAYDFKPRFYPSKDEKATARRALNKLRYGAEAPTAAQKRRDHKVIYWALSGSSVHKVYYYMDHVIGRLMLESDARVILAGAGLDEMLTVGWEAEERVMNAVGLWDIRTSLAVAQMADVVVGPETGALNAVAMEPMRKVVLMSHSSPENLTKHWANTIAVTPDMAKAPCWPCHQMHYGWKTCRRDEETGTALCAAHTNPARVADAVLDAIQTRKAA